MAKEDFWAGIGAGISSIATALAWLWNAGPLQLLFSFLTGSFATYLFQSRLQDRLEKRNREREKFVEMKHIIYGPLFKAVNRFYEALQSFSGELNVKDVEEITGEYLYFVVSEELRKIIQSFTNRIKRYLIIQGATRGVADKIRIDVLRENLQIPQQMDATVDYRIFVGSALVKRVSLYEAILLGKTPKEIIEQESVGLKGTAIIISVCGYPCPDIEKVHSVCEIALEKLKINPMFQETEMERKLLANQAQEIIDSLKPFIG